MLRFSLQFNRFFSSADSLASSNKFLSKLLEATPLLRNPSANRCYNCGTVGHRSADCTAHSIRKACFNCGSAGHISRECKEVPKPIYCFRCRNPGHYSNECTVEKPQEGDEWKDLLLL